MYETSLLADHLRRLLKNARSVLDFLHPDDTPSVLAAFTVIGAHHGGGLDVLLTALLPLPSESRWADLLSWLHLDLEALTSSLVQKTARTVKVSFMGGE